MDYRVDELEGALLDAAVAMANGIPLERRGGAVVTASYDQNHLAEPFPYSRLWEYGCPIMERERISAIGSDDGRPWQAHATYTWEHAPERLATQYGPTFLVAAMRAYVASKFGEMVELPDGD